MLDFSPTTETEHQIEQFWAAVDIYQKLSDEYKASTSSSRSNQETTEAYLVEQKRIEAYRKVLQLGEAMGFDSAAIYAATTLQTILGRNPNLQEIRQARDEIEKTDSPDPSLTYRQIEWLRIKLGANNIIHAGVELAKMRNALRADVLNDNHRIAEVLDNLKKAQIDLKGFIVLDFFANTPVLQQLTQHGAQRVIHIDNNRKFQEIHQGKDGYRQDYVILDLLKTTAQKILRQVHEDKVDGIFILRPPQDDLESLKAFFDLAKKLLRGGGFLYVKFDHTGILNLDAIPEGEKPYCVCQNGLVRIFRYFTIPPTIVHEDSIGNKEVLNHASAY